MSTHFTGQARALPFTGLTSGLLLAVGAVSTVIGVVMTKVRDKNEA